MLSVRLACVRHAASVRPEPGSNSLKNGIKTTEVALIFFRASLLICTLACVVGVKPPTVIRVPNRCKKLTGCVSFFAFFTLFNFQGPRAPFFGTALLSYHTRSRMSTLFFKFFQFFSKKYQTAESRQFYAVFRGGKRAENVRKPVNGERNFHFPFFPASVDGAHK